MASSLHLILLVCLVNVLWTGANAKCPYKGRCCEKCPTGWAEFGTRCFMFYFQEKDWADAEKTCVELGGNLASIQTTLDYKILRDMVFKATGINKETWIGGNDGVKEGVWLWSDGSKFAFSGWFKGEPNNNGGEEHCMEINYKGRDYVNDMKCAEKRSFICARDLVNEP